MTERSKTIKLRTLLAAGAITCAAGAVSAAPLSYSGDANLTIPGWNDGIINIGGVPYDPQVDPIIQSFADSGNTTNFNPLNVDSSTVLEFTYILSEAGNTNTANLFLNTGGQTPVEIFNNKVNVAGNTYVTSVGAGLLDFTYCTDGAAGGGAGCINNLTGLPSGNSGLKIASTEIFQVNGRDTVFFLFGDGAGDADLSDLVVRVQAAAVPLPAGAILILTALGGLGALRARKRRS